MDNNQSDAMLQIYRDHPEWREMMLDMYGAPSPQTRYLEALIAIKRMESEPMMLLTEAKLNEGAHS